MKGNSCCAGLLYEKTYSENEKQRLIERERNTLFFIIRNSREQSHFLNYTIDSDILLLNISIIAVFKILDCTVEVR